MKCTSNGLQLIGPQAVFFHWCTALDVEMVSVVKVSALEHIRPPIYSLVCHHKDNERRKLNYKVSRRVQQ